MSTEKYTHEFRKGSIVNLPDIKSFEPESGKWWIYREDLSYDLYYVEITKNVTIEVKIKVEG